MNMSFPYRQQKSGLTSTSDEQRHIKEMIELVLFTQPGERVNRPDFGAGVAQLVFSTSGDELAAATQLLVQGTLQRELSGHILVQEVEVRSEDSKLYITVKYSTPSSEGQELVAFERTK